MNHYHAPRPRGRQQLQSDSGLGPAPSYGDRLDDPIEKRALRVGDRIRIGSAAGARGIVLQIVGRGVLVAWTCGGVRLSGKFEFHQLFRES